MASWTFNISTQTFLAAWQGFSPTTYLWTALMILFIAAVLMLCFGELAHTSGGFTLYIFIMLVLIIAGYYVLRCFT